MDSEIIAAIISTVGGIVGGIITAIINRLPSPTSSNTQSTNEIEDTFHRRRVSIVFIISLVLIATGIILFLISIIDKIEENTGETFSEPSISTEYEPTTEDTSVSYVKIGSVRTFGQYEQDNDESNGPEDIQWIVLKQEGDEILVISVLGLEPLSYAKNEEISDWNNSSIRDWLNSTFYQTAFSDEEKVKIIEKDILPDINLDYPNLNQGEKTKDRVFLLSSQEYTELMYKKVDIKSEYCYGTLSDHAASEGADLEYAPYCWWWLRTSGKDKSTACSVTAYGVPDPRSRSIRSAKGIVRPAMWIKVE